MSENSNPSDSATRVSLLMRMRDVSDQGTWREFVECYGPRVLNWCRQFGLQDADAADAAQMVLLKLVDQLQRFEYESEQGRFRSWLKTVTRHVAVDVQRNWGHRGMKNGVAEFDQVADSRRLPEEELYAAIESAWQEDLLRMAESQAQFRVLPETWRVYWLCCREQRSAQSVASELAVPLSAVYVAKSRVLKLLRQEVHRLDPECNGI